jgi:hypothetical protein
MNKQDVFAKLAEVQEKYPHMRVGQLISNSIRIFYGNQDIFFISDENLIDALDKFSKKF